MITNTAPTEALLIVKQENFVQAYVNEARGNAAEAYRLAGYKTKQEHVNKAAFLLLSRPNIKARIDYLLNEKRARLLAEYWEDMQNNVLSLRSIRDSKDSTNFEKITAIKAMNEMLGFNTPVKQELSVESRDTRPQLNISVIDQECADLLEKLVKLEDVDPDIKAFNDTTRNILNR